MLGWILLGIFLTLATAAITLIWWWVGDQWADDEYKKFGHGGGVKRVAEHTRVISDADQTDSSVIKGSANE